MARKQRKARPSATRAASAARSWQVPSIRDRRRKALAAYWTRVRAALVQAGEKPDSVASL